VGLDFLALVIVIGHRNPLKYLNESTPNCNCDISLSFG
jgi:hypothetical protein